MTLEDAQRSSDEWVQAIRDGSAPIPPKLVRDLLIPMAVVLPS